jgi:hypothetical protein
MHQHLHSHKVCFSCISADTSEQHRAAGQVPSGAGIGGDVPLWFPLMAQDLFASAAAPDSNYDASSIEVLEGLEPVRRRPGMYVGGTDERALHHLAAEVLDNAMDEAVAGHATRIEVTLEPGNRLTPSFPTRARSR